VQMTLIKVQMNLCMITMTANLEKQTSQLIKSLFLIVLNQL